MYIQLTLIKAIGINQKALYRVSQLIVCPLQLSKHES